MNFVPEKLNQQLARAGIKTDLTKVMNKAFNRRAELIRLRDSIDSSSKEGPNETYTDEEDFVKSPKKKSNLPAAWLGSPNDPHIKIDKGHTQSFNVRRRNDPQILKRFYGE